MNQTLTNVPPHPDDSGAQLRRRREAANAPDVHRLACGRRDPLDPLPRPAEPSDFGLSESELWAEIRRCRAAGWLDWELQQRFRNPTDLRRALDAARAEDRILHPELEYAA